MKDALALTLLHFVWQGGLLGLAAGFALRIVRPERATTRHAIGVATLALMLAGTVTTFAILSRAPLSPAVASAAPLAVSASAGVAADRREAVDEVVDTRAGQSMILQSASIAERGP